MDWGKDECLCADSTEIMHTKCEDLGCCVPRGPRHFLPSLDVRNQGPRHRLHRSNVFCGQALVRRSGLGEAVRIPAGLHTHTQPTGSRSNSSRIFPLISPPTCGLLSVTVIIVRNGIGKLSSNLGQGCLRSLRTNPIYPTPSARAGYDTRSIF